MIMEQASMTNIRGHSGDELVGVRQMVHDRAREMGVTLAQFSRAIGRNQAYIHQYMFKGTARRLDKDSRHVVADLLQLDADQLREAPARQDTTIGLLDGSLTVG